MSTFSSFNHNQQPNHRKLEASLVKTLRSPMVESSYRPSRPISEYLRGKTIAENLLLAEAYSPCGSTLYSIERGKKQTRVEFSRLLTVESQKLAPRFDRFGHGKASEDDITVLQGAFERYEKVASSIVQRFMFLELSVFFKNVNSSGLEFRPFMYKPILNTIRTSLRGFAQPLSELERRWSDFGEAMLKPRVVMQKQEGLLSERSPKVPVYTLRYDRDSNSAFLTFMHEFESRTICRFPLSFEAQDSIERELASPRTKVSVDGNKALVTSIDSQGLSKFILLRYSLSLKQDEPVPLSLHLQRNADSTRPREFGLRIMLGSELASLIAFSASGVYSTVNFCNEGVPFNCTHIHILEPRQSES